MLLISSCHPSSTFSLPPTTHTTPLIWFLTIVHADINHNMAFNSNGGGFDGSMNNGNSMEGVLPSAAPQPVSNEAARTLW